MDKLLLDINIILDALFQRRPFDQAATALLKLAAEGKVEIYVSALSYPTLFYLLRQKLSQDEVYAALTDLHTLAADSAPISHADIGEALSRRPKDFEDHLQYLGALNVEGIAAIITRDPDGYEGARLPVLSAADYLQRR